MVTADAGDAVEVTLPGTDPDESWSDEMLLYCGRKEIEESNRLESQVQPFIRQSIASRLRGGHAMSILRTRLRAEGRWTSYQQGNALPRTTVWQMAEVYERAMAQGLTTQDLADRYGNWTGVLLGYGLVKPRKSKGGGHVVEPLEPPVEEEDGGGGDDIDDDDPGDDPQDEPEDGDAEEDGDDQEPNAGAHDPEPEDEPPPVTDDQIVAADAFVSAVGGLEHAARALIATSIKSGDKDAVKGTLAEVVRAARAVLTPSEITTIMIIGTPKEKGIQVMTV
jgi:hypothetical protein